MQNQLRRYHWMFFSLIGLVVLLFVFGRSLGYFFWQDDFNLLQFVHDKPLQDYINISFTPPTKLLPLNLGVVFRPIPHYIYFKISQSLFGNNPLPFRLGNFLLYFVSAIFVVILARMITNKSRVAWLSGILFLINRVFITPVFWISDNNELFLCLFVLISLVAYLLFLSKGGLLRWLYLCISLIALTMGLLSKETAITIPFLIVAVLLLRQNPSDISFRQRLISCLYVLLHVLIVAVFLIVRLPLITYAVNGGGGSYYKISTFQNLFNGSLWGLWWSIETFVEPWRTLVDSLTQRLGSFSLFQPLIISGVFILLVLCLMYIFVRRSKKIISVSPIILGGFWFVVTASPSLATGILVDYLFALPVIGFVLVLSYTLDYLIFDYLKIKERTAYYILGIFICFSVISANFIVTHAEANIWPVTVMQRTVDTINLVKSHEFASDESKVVCFLNMPESFWLPGRAEPALQEFVNPDIQVIELQSTQTSDSKNLCPNNSFQVGVVDNQIEPLS